MRIKPLAKMVAESIGRHVSNTGRLPPFINLTPNEQKELKEHIEGNYLMNEREPHAVPINTIEQSVFIPER